MILNICFYVVIVRFFRFYNDRSPILPPTSMSAAIARWIGKTHLSVNFPEPLFFPRRSYSRITSLGVFSTLGSAPGTSSFARINADARVLNDACTYQKCCPTNRTCHGLAPALLFTTIASSKAGSSFDRDCPVLSIVVARR